MKQKTTKEEVSVIESENEKVTELLKEIAVEYVRAKAKFGAFASRHEALGIVQEEFHEWREAIYKNDDSNAVVEAKQTMAMLLKFLMLMEENK